MFNRFPKTLRFACWNFHDVWQRDFLEKDKQTLLKMLFLKLKKVLNKSIKLCSSR